MINELENSKDWVQSNVRIPYDLSEWLATFSRRCKREHRLSKEALYVTLLTLFRGECELHNFLSLSPEQLNDFQLTYTPKEVVG